MAFLRKKGRNERGAALVEAALITPVFFLLIFGILEMGLLYRDSLTNSNAAKEGARAASVNGSSPSADFLILRSIENGIEPIGLQNLEHVVVFKASGPGAPVPAACKAGSQPGLCNRYDAASFFRQLNVTGTSNPTGHFGCTPGLSIDRYWCPGTRNTKLGESEYVGVHIETRHDYITGFFGASTNLEDTTIIRLEPTEYS